MFMCPEIFVGWGWDGAWVSEWVGFNIPINTLLMSTTVSLFIIGLWWMASVSSMSEEHDNMKWL